ncbi:hypothetical protein SAMN05444515_102255 [Ectothiorhodospira marina]|uniref:Uncharacterized protein n=2 Tax=Ectothiorhodospira marina TaxID=1396821 RepID=A0A1H7HVS5_9GAMM|nr:hypothetical protein SAMN05444515_102255 [Ectothiorhodospira marina]
MGLSVPLQADNKSVSPNYRVIDWHDAMRSDDWATMVAIFRDRLHGRFLEPIEHIEADRRIGGFAGFSIMALDCLLVETLNQFYHGLDETPKDHQRQFWKFFSGSEHFKSNFTRKVSDIFYSHVRCGLLHQAQTKKGTLIRADQDRMISPAPGGLVNGIIVDRVRFHDALKQEIATYIRTLESGEEGGADLRNNFITKMQYICGGQA